MVKALRQTIEATRRLALAAVLFLLTAAPALAQHWFATNVRGTVLMLVDDKWQDITAGQILPAVVVVRTLDSGQLTLAGTGIGIRLGGDGAVQILEGEEGLAFTHYAGSLDIEAGASTRVTVETPNGRVSFTAGSVQTVISEQKTRVVVMSGKSQIADATGRAVNVNAGQAANVAMAGTILEDPPSAGSAAEPGTPADPPPAGGGSPPVDPPDPPGGTGGPNPPGGDGDAPPGEAGVSPDGNNGRSENAQGQGNGN